MNCRAALSLRTLLTVIFVSWGLFKRLQTNPLSIYHQTAEYLPSNYSLHRMRVSCIPFCGFKELISEWKTGPNTLINNPRNKTFWVTRGINIILRKILISASWKYNHSFGNACKRFCLGYFLSYIGALFPGLWKTRRDQRHYIVSIFINLYSGIWSFIVCLCASSQSRLTTH